MSSVVRIDLAPNVSRMSFFKRGKGAKQERKVQRDLLGVELYPGRRSQSLDLTIDRATSATLRDIRTPSRMAKSPVNSKYNLGMDSAKTSPKLRFHLGLNLFSHVVLALLKGHRKAKRLLFSDSAFRDQLESIDHANSTSLALSRQADVSFDVSQYKADRQMRMTAESKRILQKVPSERTEQEIYYAMIALRGIKQIADFPVRMQRNLAQHALFESFSPKCAIVKQDYTPHAFYFILYGTVLVAVLDETSPKAKTVCYLQRGDNFGELAIMNKSLRQSTVMTKTYVELLKIDLETYEKLFMVGGARNLNDLDHSQFMESLSFLKGWPKEILIDDPKKHVFCYYKRRSVMVKDSNYSTWIYIIKSGSVDVLKKLVKERPMINSRTGELIPKEKPRPLLSSIDGQKPRVRPWHQRPKTTAGKMCRNDNVYDGDQRSFVTESCHSDGADDLCEFKVNPEQLTRRHTSAMVEKWLGGVPKPVPRRAAWSAKHTHLQNSSTKRNNRKKVKVITPEKVNQNGQTGRRTYIDDLDAGYKEREHVVTDADRNPMFVHVQTLTKGQVFGLAPLVFPKQPSFCLVSNGAECIMIDKTFYLKHCSPELLRRVQNELSPYPPEEKLQTDLSTRINWEGYKHTLLQTLCVHER